LVAYFLGSDLNNRGAPRALAARFLVRYARLFYYQLFRY
ncbi:MAG: hypothetical protein ACJA2E_001392, partial [Arenicella sp.]